MKSKKNNTDLQVDEKYVCQSQGHGKISYEQATDNWECPKCFNKLAIRVEIDNRFQTIHRINPHELIDGDLITTKRYSNIWEVIDVTPSFKKENVLRIALREFGTYEVDQDMFVSKIIGGWFE